MAMSDELEQRCLAAALARARDTCSRLGDDSQVRSKMEAFLDVLAPMLQLDRAHRGDKPSMKNAGLRRRVADDLPVGHPLKASRAAAFDRVEELLQEGWPRLSRTECRQKSQRLMDSEGARAPSQHTFPRTRSRTNFHARAHAQFSVPQMRRLQRPQMRHLHAQCWLRMDGLSMANFRARFQLLRRRHCSTFRSALQLQSTERHGSVVEMFPALPFVRFLFPVHRRLTALLRCSPEASNTLPENMAAAPLATMVDTPLTPSSSYPPLLRMDIPTAFARTR